MHVRSQYLHRKQQKLSRREVLWCDKICESVEKTFMVLPPLCYQFCFQNQLVGKTLAIHQKSAKTAKAFSRLTSVVYGI